MECNSQSNGKVERYTNALVIHLRHYIDEHQTNWNMFVEPITHGYKTHVYRTTQTSPFRLNLSQDALRALAMPKAITDGISQLSQTRAKLKVVTKFWQLMERDDTAANTARDSYA